MRSQTKFAIVGKCADKHIVDGVFSIYETHGVPLDIILSRLNQDNLLCCWPSFMESSIQAGWNPRSTLAKIETACADVYGRKVADEIMFRLRLVIIGMPTLEDEQQEKEKKNAI